MNTDYNKTDGPSPTRIYLTGHNSQSRFRSDHHTHQHTHCQNTGIILMADKHNIPKSKMHSNCRHLPDHTVCKITQINNIRRANTCDPALKLLNDEITSDIQKQKHNICKEHLDAHWDHRHTTHILWQTIHSLSNRAPLPTLNTSITFIATKQQPQPNTLRIVSPNNSQPLSSTKNRYINRATQKYITLHSLQLRSKRQ